MQLRVLSFLLLAFSCYAFAQSDTPTQLRKLVEQDYPYLLDLYHHYHAHPELSFYEKETAERMASELEQLGFELHKNIGGHGLVGVFENGEGPTILVRADMDALPIDEETDLPYASEVTTTDEAGNTVGVMHACGHDVHMTVWTGTARALVQLKEQWQGTLLFLGQPAEERAGGAKAMLADGLYEKFPLPDYAIALHVNAGMAAGTVGIRPEYALANVDMADITVYGEGGHGAYPHTTKDPVLLAARIIASLQTIVSREISPLEPAVVTVGSIHGGSKGNVIPDEVHMELTMRSYSDEVRNAIIEKMQRICQGEAIAAGLPESKFPKVEVRNESIPSVWNDPALTERIGERFRAVLGTEQVKTVDPVMAGEDFGLYGRQEQRVPVSIFWLGTVAPAQVAAAERGELVLPPLHSSKFAPVPEPTLKTGVVAMTAAVLELLGE